MSHFDEITCLLYLDGQLEHGRARELVAHAESCGDCRALLAALERESRLLRDALTEEDEVVPARPLGLPAPQAASWAWAASLGLAAAGAYTLWTGIIEPWFQQFNQAGFGQGSLLTLLFFSGAFWKGWGAMANALQILAAMTLGILALALLRRALRRWTTVAVVLSVVALLALPRAAAAAEIKHTTTYTLPSGEVLKNDLIVGARSVRIDGTVDGDLITFCKSVTINGRVTGDVIAFTRSLRLNGQVDGNVRSFVGYLYMVGPVGKNVMAFVQDFQLDAKSQVGGSLTLFAGSATLEGRVARDLLGFLGELELNGFVGGNAKVRADHHFTIGPKAEIQGQVSYKGYHQPEVSPQAKLASPLAVEILSRRPDYASPRFYWRQALRWGAAFLLGLVIALLLPSFFAEVLGSSRRYGVSLGVGVVALIVIPVVAVIACITLVGLAVGIISLLLWAMALYAAQVFVGAWLGQKLLGESGGTGALLGRLAVGLLVLRVVGNVPYLGHLVWLAVLIWGLGALTLALYARLRPQTAAA